MDRLKDFLWPVVLVGGFGALIDFLIGRTGQAKTKDLLLKWWVRFDDIGWINFGREEGFFAAQLIERYFGKHIWSLRRAVSAVVTVLVLYLFATIVLYSQSRLYVTWAGSGYEVRDYTVNFILSIVSFAFSVSFTRYIALSIARNCGTSTLKNCLLFAFGLIFNYFLLVIWSPFTLSVKVTASAMMANNYLDWIFFPSSLIGFIWTIFKEGTGSHLYPSAIFREFHDLFLVKSVDSAQTEFFAFSVAAALPSVFRLFLSGIFVGSFLLRPLILRPVSLVWARIVESDKPVFTLIFGGTSALASAISEAAKHL
jgi:hypothetical protein